MQAPWCQSCKTYALSLMLQQNKTKGFVSSKFFRLVWCLWLWLEPTWVEHITVPFNLGLFMVLLANIRLARKNFPKTNNCFEAFLTSKYFWNVKKLFFLLHCRFNKSSQVEHTSMHTALLPSIILAWKKLVETNTQAFLYREPVAKQKKCLHWHLLWMLLTVFLLHCHL